MDRFFAPRCVAVAGASNDETKLGHQVMRRLLGGADRRIVPIHPRAKRLLGVPARTDLASLTEHVDLLVSLVPGERLLPLIESAGEGQVSYLLAICSGFAEVSAEGERLQRRLVEAARRRGIRVVGPNSMGVLNAAAGLNASLVPEMPSGGAGLSCITQSGGFGIAASMYALDNGLPVAKICDLGNTADIDATEVLAHLAEDPETRVIGLYLEAPRDRAALVAAAARLASRKPVILTTLARTEAGQRASRAHLGLSTAIGETRRPTGPLIGTATGQELLDVAKALCWQPSPRGPRAAILTATGGIGSELADLCVEAGIAVPTPPEAIRGELKGLLPPLAAVDNPIDVTPEYRRFAEIYPAAMRVLLRAEEIDLLIVAITDVATASTALAEAVAREACRDAAPTKPIYVLWGSRDGALANMSTLQRARLPCYRSTSVLVRAAAAQLRFGTASRTRTPR